MDFGFLPKSLHRHMSWASYAQRALLLDRWCSNTSLARQSGLAEQNCAGDGVSQAVYLRMEQGLMGNSGVIITQFSLWSTSRQSHLKSTSFTAVKVRMFVLEGQLIHGQLLRLIYPSYVLFLLCVCVCVCRYPWSFITVKGDASTAVEDHAVYQGEPTLPTSSAMESKQQHINEISWRRAVSLSWCWCVFVCSGTKASSEARSSRVFHSGYGEHFTITTISQWVQGTNTPLHLCKTHTHDSFFWSRLVHGGLGLQNVIK